MISPSDVNLIIFDLDGTIVPSLMPFYESVRRAFARLGWPVTFRPEDVYHFFGVTTASVKGSVYEFVTPPGSQLSVEEVRDKIHAEDVATFRELGQTYPEVKDTLKILRQRGYKLAQYTNGSTRYLNVVMSSLGLKEYYDYIESIQDNNLNKEKLVKKIRERFGGAGAAVVGDRSHDIEAARANGCLSVGALFGYGRDEPEAADITIASFADLLTIFDRRRTIFETVEAEIKRRKTADRPFVIGVSGIDCSGKTVFTGALEKYLNANGYETQRVSLDDFHNPKAVRYAGADPVDNYFNRSFDIPTVVEKLLAPLREKGRHTTTLKLLGLRTDKYDVTRKYSFSRRTIVLFEGVFLFRKELAQYTDYKIFLDIPYSVSKKRAALRDPVASLDKYDTKYLPAQRRYLRAYPPRRTADMVVDNTDWEKPVIKYPH
jgi:uridine kinase